MALLVACVKPIDRPGWSKFCRIKFSNTEATRGVWQKMGGSLELGKGSGEWVVFPDEKGLLNLFFLMDNPLPALAMTFAKVSRDFLTAYSQKEHTGHGSFGETSRLDEKSIANAPLIWVVGPGTGALPPEPSPIPPHEIRSRLTTLPEDRINRIKMRRKSSSPLDLFSGR